MPSKSPMTNLNTSTDVLWSDETKIELSGHSPKKICGEVSVSALGSL